MAKSEKIENPVVIPKSLSPLVEAFSAESELTAKLLIEQAAAAIYYECDDHWGLSTNPKPIKKDDIDSVYNMMKGLRPVDPVEVIFAAQIVTGHLLGMKKLAQPTRDDQTLGLKLLRLSNDAMDRLFKKRCLTQANTAFSGNL